jgi:DnaK suppressor protein
MPLTQLQRDYLARRLREEREYILRALRRYDERLTATEQDAAGDLSKIPFHPADTGTDAFDREVGAQEVSRLSRELVEVDAALRRLYRDPERFGRDEHTGDEIPFERLDIIPWARTRVTRSPRAA